jgi:hypothetical protein
MIRENSEFKLLRFEKSKNPDKKYDAIVLNKKSGRERRIGFGARGYENYADRSGLGLYKNVSHGDKERRDRYRQRHPGEGDNSNFPNPGFWAYHVLWT